MSLGFYVALYLLITLATGFAATLLIHGARDFLQASRRLPFGLSAMALFALWYGSETVFGASGAFVEGGLLGVIEDPFGGFLCLVLFGLFLVRPLYRRNLLTLGDLFREAYGPHVELVSSLFMILTFVGYIAAQLIALGLLFETVVGLDPLAGRVLSAAIVCGYTAAGGMWAVSITDFVQSLVIMAGLTLLCVHLGAVEGYDAAFVPPREHFFDFVPTRANGASWSDWFAAWLTLGLGSLASQDIFQRANAARSEAIAVRSTLFAAVLYLTFALLPLYLGLLVFRLEPALAAGDAQSAVLRLVAGHAPFWLQVLFYGALISAIFSTCSGALLAPSSILAENFIKPLFLRTAGDAALLHASRLSVLAMALIATGVSLMSDSIYVLVAESSILGAVSILVPMLDALFGKRHVPAAALLSMSLGLASYVVVEYAIADFPVPSLFVGMLVSLAGLGLGKVLPQVPPAREPDRAGPHSGAGAPPAGSDP